MLLITLREGDYFMVGEDIKISYARSDGKDQINIGIDAPKHVPILRGQLYEQEIAEQAAAGNPKAQIMHKRLLNEYEQRTHKYNKRRLSRAEYERRTQAGEIRPSQPTVSEDDPLANQVERMEKRRKKLAEKADTYAAN